jgi:ATP-binding cassette subfamily B protein
LSERWRVLLARWTRAQLLGVTFPLASIALFGLAASGAFIGGYLLHARGLMTLGTVYVLVYYAYILARPIRELAQQEQSLQNVGASAERIRELRAVTPSIRDGTDGRLRETGPVELSFDSVSFSYLPREPVLQGVSFTVAKGEVLGLLGRTGSGKSTVARLLCRFYDPEAGVIRLDGMDIRTLAVASIRSRVGLVTQEVQIFRASVRDNLTFFDNAITDQAIRSALDALGLSGWLKRMPDGLSTEVSDRGLSAGEAQLVAFARVFLRNPGLVVLDEASSRLDPATEEFVQRAVDRLLEGRTAIIIAHRPAAFERARDILIIENGRAVEYGERARLAADPRSRFARLGREPR